MNKVDAIASWLRSFANGLADANSSDDAAQVYEAATLLRQQEEMIRRLERDNVRGQAAIATLSELVAILMGEDESQPRYTTKRLKQEIARATETSQADLKAMTDLAIQHEDRAEKAEAERNEYMNKAFCFKLDADNAEVEVVKLRAALEAFVHYENWMDEHDDKADCPVHARITFGDLRRARAALGGE